MLNILWPIFIIISYGYALLTGNIENVNNSIFESSKNAVQLSMTLLGTMCLWTGMMRIIENTSLMKKITTILKPLIYFLFPDVKKDSEAMDQISMNIASNVLGLGNAATPIGLKAMQTLQKDNKNKDIISDSMAMFIVINTASIQIIPTTVIAIRTSLESNAPTSIVFPVWCATIAAAIAGIAVVKLFTKLRR